MAFSIPAKYKEEISVKGKTQEELMRIALETAKALEWGTRDITTTGFYAGIGFSMLSFSEVIHVLTYDDMISIKSQCVGIQMFDWGKNKKNVNAFKTQLNKLLN
jgi:rhomboid protease GluP